MNPRADVLIEEELQTLAHQEQERDDLIDIEFLIQERDEIVAQQNALATSVTAPVLGSADLGASTRASPLASLNAHLATRASPTAAAAATTTTTTGNRMLRNIQEIQSAEWKCSQCTFMNEASMVACEMCTQPKIAVNRYDQHQQRYMALQAEALAQAEKIKKKEEEAKQRKAEAEKKRKEEEARIKEEEEEAEKKMIFAEKLRAAKKFLEQGRELYISRSTSSLRVRYKLGDMFGAGSFGQVYFGEDIVNGDRVAVKTEPLAADHPQLVGEYKIYTRLQGGLGFPNVRFFGVEDDSYNMVLDLLGDSLDKLVRLCGGRFGLKTTVMIALQLVDRMEYLHNSGHIHRDLKPDNMTIGRGNKTICIRGVEIPESNILHIIDFGLAQQFRNKEHRHIAYRSNLGGVCGTPRYASLNSHLGIEQSRRDDLEGILYVLLYVHKGLPWQNLPWDEGPGRRDKIMEMKQSITTEELFKKVGAGRQEFIDFYEYVKKLQFEDAPDYKYLKGLFLKLFESQGFVQDGIFDWTELKKAQEKKDFEDKQEEILQAAILERRIEVKARQKERAREKEQNGTNAVASVCGLKELNASAHTPLVASAN
jgi:hypothetical protein